MRLSDLQERCVVSPGGCWVWQDAKDPKGYGICKFQGRKERTHRVARILMGDDVVGKHVDHLCRNTSCCNPNHLETVTPSINSRRRWGIYE